MIIHENLKFKIEYQNLNAFLSKYFNIIIKLSSYQVIQSLFIE